MKKNIITIATGKQLYIELAMNLAKSFLWWNKGSDIDFYIITDQQISLSAELAEKIKIKIVSKGDLGEGFSSKLYLDQLAPGGQTLFIDSDCLIFGDLQDVFNRFKGHKVSVVGGYIADGEWFGDVQAVCRQFNVPHILKFNGGIYYLEKGPEADAVYNTARELEKRYDEIGFTRLRNKPNDEVIMALAMQLHGQTPLLDDGTIMSDPQACPGGYDLDVIKGKRWLLNPPAPSPLHQNWYPFEKVHPLVVHFLGYYTNHYPYKREVFRLDRALANKLGLAAEAEALFKIEYPARIKNSLKDTFRPIFRRIFGTRKVKVSERV